jgi:hypothetical protein
MKLTPETLEAQRKDWHFPLRLQRLQRETLVPSSRGLI